MANKDKKIENEVVEEVIINVDEEEVIEMKPKKTEKIVAFGKKHGKKILTGIGAAVALGVGYALGAKIHDDDDIIRDGDCIAIDLVGESDDMEFEAE